MKLLDRLKNVSLVSQLLRSFQQWQRDDGPMLAAAVSYYAALSFFPVLLILISSLGFVLRFTGWGQDAQQQLIEFIADQSSQNIADQVSAILAGVQSGAPFSGPLGLVTLVIAAIAIFAQFERAFDRIWNIEPAEGKGILATIKNALFNRLRAFVMLFAVGALVTLTFATGLVLSMVAAFARQNIAEFEGLWDAAQLLATVTLNCLAFTLVYRTLPKVEIHWSEAARGGLLAAVIWEVGRQVLSLLVIGGKYSAYGVVGSFIAILLWIYYAATVIFLAAEYVQVICEDCRKGEDLSVAS